MKSFTARVAVTCAAFVLLAGTSFADDVQTDFDHHADFQSYHTYSWGKTKVSDELNADRIKREVDYFLHKEGWQEVPSGGQITLMSTDKIHDEKEAETMYDGMGGGWGMGWGWGGWGWGPGGGFGNETTTTRNVQSAHLVVDMFDSQSKKLLWRGVSQEDLSNNPENNRKKLHQDLAKMFGKFPPKTKD